MQGKADLHIHSHYSKDSFASLKNILKTAQKEGLDVIAITDHDEVKGAKEAQAMAPEFGLEVVVGEEIETREGDLLALFIDDKISSGRPITETIKEVHKQGGLAVVPHPSNLLLGGVSLNVIVKVSHQLDGIELFNGSWLGKIKRKKSKELNKAILNLAAVGGSDAHLARQVGSGYTIFPGKSKEDLYRAIKEKTTTTAGTSWSYWDRLFWLLTTPVIFLEHPLVFCLGIGRPLKKTFGLKNRIKL